MAKVGPNPERGGRRGHHTLHTIHTTHTKQQQPQPQYSTTHRNTQARFGQTWFWPNLARPLKHKLWPKVRWFKVGQQEFPSLGGPCVECWWCLSTTTLLHYLRVWIDVEPGPHDKSCFAVSKKMIKLLRHDPSVFREENGAVEFRILASLLRSEITSSSHESIRTWLSFL